jgi:hypothetical protein
VTGRRMVSGKETDNKNESSWQMRTEILPEDKSEEFARYPTVTAEQLKSRKERPKRVKMLMRDFIEGLLHDCTLIELSACC